MIILGINAYHANASAAIVVDGRLIAAVEEERLNRVKYAAGLPARAIQFCLDVRARSSPTSITSPSLAIRWARIGTKLRFAAAHAALRPGPCSRDEAALPGFAKISPPAFELSRRKAFVREFHRIEHHTAHLASAFFVSPFEQAAVLSADGLGDFASAMWALGEARKCKLLGEVAFPHSLGMFYTALTQYLGFWKFGDEYKVMGLAAYGQPEFLDEFRRIVRADATDCVSPGPANISRINRKAPK